MAQQNPTGMSKLDLFEGEWTFKAYFPNHCKELPECHIDKMKFIRLNPKTGPDGYAGFNTLATKKGQCKEGDDQLKHYGYTWITKDLFNFGGGQTAEKPESETLFKQTADEYKIGFDKDDPNKHALLLKHRGIDKKCFTYFEKILDQK